MAWGIFNKIKKGFQKVVDVGKKVVNKVANVAKKVNENIIKPAMPVLKTVVNKFIPGGGAIVEAASDGIDRYTNEDGSANFGAAAGDVRTWAKNKWGK